jgi:hypothetical protein
MEKPTNIERFKKAVENGKFTMEEQLTFIEILLTKYKFISKSEYAKKEAITPQGVEARLKANNDSYLIMLGKFFIID